MKTRYRLYLLSFLLLLAGSSCKKSFQELTINTNVPNSVPSPIYLNGILNDFVDLPNSSPEIADQYYIYNYDYYGNNRYDFSAGKTYYKTLINVKNMELAEFKAGHPALNPYSALGKFFKAYFFSKMSLEMGDIPLSEALKGLNNLTPVYDSQKSVMIQSFKWLDSANTDLASLIKAGGTTLDGDFLNSGDLSKWQKVVNTFRIRLLTQLSKKAADPDLNVSTQFASIVGDAGKYPLMTSSLDNLQYTFIAPTNYYPQNPDNFGQEGSRKNTSQTYIGLLTQFKDPRVFVTAEPARYLVDSLNQSPIAFNSFIGADAGLDLGEMYKNAGLQKYSFLNRKQYYSSYTGEPSIQIGYAELQFNIAEGINRGWASGNAEPYYKNGIQSSMASYQIPLSGTFTAYFYRPGSSSVKLLTNYDTYPVNFDFASYYSQPTVQYAGNTLAGLTEILQQKYIALFRHSGLESYFTWRRTGVPNFTTGAGTGNSTRIALRYQYPTSESTANTSNYQKALQSQYGGQDDINGVMWILK